MELILLWNSSSKRKKVLVIMLTQEVEWPSNARWNMAHIRCFQFQVLCCQQKGSL